MVELLTAKGTHETARVNGWEVAPDALSVTETVKLDVPTPVGVPLITPAVDSDNPAGRVPLARDHI